MTDADTLPGRDGCMNPAAHIGSLHRWGCELEFTLPAGALVWLNGKEHKLLAPVRVRSADPCTVLEGKVEAGSEEDRNWPSSPEDGSGGVACEFVRMEDAAIPRERCRRRVAMLRLDEKDVPDWLRERVAASTDHLQGGDDKPAPMG